jgi:hypothetical protein
MPLKVPASNHDDRASNRNVVNNGGDDLVFDKFLSEEHEQCSTYVRTELDLYLKEPSLARTQEFDIIHWW